MPQLKNIADISIHKKPTQSLDKPSVSTDASGFSLSPSIPSQNSSHKKVGGADQPPKKHGKSELNQLKSRAQGFYEAGNSKFTNVKKESMPTTDTRLKSSTGARAKNSNFRKANFNCSLVDDHHRRKEKDRKHYDRETQELYKKKKEKRTRR